MQKAFIEIFDLIMRMPVKREIWNWWVLNNIQESEPFNLYFHLFDEDLLAFLCHHYKLFFFLFQMII